MNDIDRKNILVIGKTSVVKSLAALFASVVLFSVAAPLVSGCKPESHEEPAPTPPVPGTDPTPTPGTGELASVSTMKIGEIFTIPLTGRLHLPYSGIKQGDEIVFTLRSDNSVRYNLVCASADDSKGAWFTVPEHFIGAMCTVSAFGKTAETFVSVEDTTAVDKVPGRTAYGRVIDWDGKPVPGVSVSDGVLVTNTDSEGRYYLSSMRKNGYVFISVPKNYRVAVNRTIPQFFKRFKSASSSEYELNTFILEPENNERHRLLAFTDCHLANRTNDVSQFDQIFKSDIRGQVSMAERESIPVYAVCLGDLSWDEWWYKNSYSIENYYRTMEDMDIPVYNIPGNHDNDPYIPDDFRSENMFRKWIGPTYYSFNVGDVHYIMMDNTLFRNKGASEGVVGDVQDYSEGFTSNELKWLEADLANVPAGSTVFLGMHIQYTGRPSGKADGTFQFAYSLPPEYRSEIVRLLDGFNVHIITGHTHVNYTNEISDRLIEHNIAAVCATWWWTGYYSSNRAHLCRDGAPGGYKIFDIQADGSVKWSYKSLNRDDSYQFRVYDLNNCYITRPVFCPGAKSKVTDEIFSKYAYGYDKSRSDNKLLVNVFDYDEGWTVKAFEGGKELNVKRVDGYDPLHVVHFNMARMNTNSASVTFPTLKTSHLFEVQASDATSSVTVVVTDRFGNEYRETVSRPRKLYDMSKASTY